MNKGRTIKNQAFLFFLFSTLPIFFISTLYANILPVHVQIVDNGDGGDDGSDDPWVIEGNSVNITYKIRLTSLYSLSESSPYYVLPPGTPDILFRCSFGVETFDFYPSLFTIADDIEADQTVYEWSTTVNVSMVTNCDVYPNSISKITKILTTSGSVYPIGAHSSSGDIFSCSVFSETYFCCIASCPSDEEMSERKTTYFITCDDSGGAEPYSEDDGEGEEGDSGEGYGYAIQILPDAIGVYPNPCTDNAILEMELDNNILVTLTIFNTAGQKVWSQSEGAEKGKYQTQIDTKNWLPGIYIGQMQCGDRMETFRLSKM